MKYPHSLESAWTNANSGSVTGFPARGVNRISSTEVCRDGPDLAGTVQAAHHPHFYERSIEKKRARRGGEPFCDPCMTPRGGMKLH